MRVPMPDDRLEERDRVLDAWAEEPFDGDVAAERDVLRHPADEGQLEDRR